MGSQRVGHDRAWMQKFFLIFFSIMVCYRILYVVHCGVQEDLLFIHSVSASSHPLILNSPSIPPLLPLPLGSPKSVLCVCESVSYLCSFVLYFRFHIYVISWYLSFSVWLTSVSMIISRSIHGCYKWHYFILFLWLSNIPLYIYIHRMCTTLSLSIHLLMDIWVVPMSWLL